MKRLTTLLTVIAVFALAATGQIQDESLGFELPSRAGKAGFNIARPMQVRPASDADTTKIVARDVTVSRAGELADLLGDDKLIVDSLVVRGPINDADFNTLWEAGFYGDLEVLDLASASIEGNRIPKSAFFHKDIQIDSANNIFYVLILEKIVLPDAVTEMGDSAFYYNRLLTSINMPKQLKRIGKSTFKDCRRLTFGQLILPEGFEETDNLSFWNCEINSDVIFPSSIERIGRDAFAYSRLTGFEIPADARCQIDMGAFCETRCLKKDVIIPNGCEIIGWGHFWGSYVENVVLPEGMNCIPDMFLVDAKYLQSVKIPSTVKSIDNSAFLTCTRLKSIELPDGLEEIDMYGLAQMHSLQSINFPKNLKRLGDSSCWEWDSIKVIYSQNPIPPECEPGVYQSQTPFGYYDGSTTTPRDTPLYVPVGSADKYRNAYGWNYFTNIIETDKFPSAIEGIDADEGMADQPIYDLMGRRVEHPRKGQIYIRGGKKYMVR